MAYALIALTVALMLSALVLSLVTGATFATDDWGTGRVVLAMFFCAVVYPAVGALIVLRGPGNSVGWVCLGIGAGLGFTAFASEYARYALVTNPGSLPGGLIAGWADNWSYLTFVIPLGTILPLVFPAGRLPSPRWRVVGALAGAAALASFTLDALNPDLVNFPGHANPFGATTWVNRLEPLFLLLPLSFVASASAVVVRFRRSSGDERAQLKWFAYAATVLAASFVIIVPLGSGAWARFAQDVVTFMFAGLALATGIAILKFRLYAIDRIINRTLVYGALTVTLTFGYLVSVLGLQAVLPVADDSPAVVAASTLAVVALFRPLRSRIQHLVDRRFYRRRYDAERTVESFGSRLRRQIDLEALSAELVAVTKETMQPEHASLWLAASSSAGGLGSADEENLGSRGFRNDSGTERA
ncbi:MAG: hypothetical protein ACRDJ0_09360 [Actinomycetota bacterium]